MYRFFYLLAVALGLIVCLYTGAVWWSAAVVSAALAVLFPVWRRSAFWFAWLAGLLVWGIFAGYLHVASEGRLSDRLAVTFGMNSGWLLVITTGAWGALTAAFGGWFGASVRRLAAPKHVAEE